MPRGSATCARRRRISPACKVLPRRDDCRAWPSGRVHSLREEISIKTPWATPLAALLALAAGVAFAADDMKKDDGMMKKEAMTMQECKDHMAMAKKDGMKKDAVCADMMKKDDAMMKKEEPMKK